MSGRIEPEALVAFLRESLEKRLTENANQKDHNYLTCEDVAAIFKNHLQWTGAKSTLAAAVGIASPNMTYITKAGVLNQKFLDAFGLEKIEVYIKRKDDD